MEGSLRALEDAKHAVTFASGLGALTTLMSCYCQGDHIVMGDDMYGGNFRLLNKVGKNFGLEMTTVDASDVDNVKRVMKPNTKVSRPSYPQVYNCFFNDFCFYLSAVDIYRNADESSTQSFRHQSHCRGGQKQSRPSGRGQHLPNSVPSKTFGFGSGLIDVFFNQVYERPFGRYNGCHSNK